MIQKFEKSFHNIVELVETNPLMYNTLHFDQYPRLVIPSNILQFSANNSKFEKKKIKVQVFVWRSWYRRNRFRNVLSKTFRMIYDTPTWKIVGDEEKNIPPPILSIIQTKKTHSKTKKANVLTHYTLGM